MENSEKNEGGSACTAACDKEFIECVEFEENNCLDRFHECSGSCRS